MPAGQTGHLGDRNVGGGVDDGAMARELDKHAAQREELLAPVKDLCAGAGVTTETGLLPLSRYDRKRPPVLALRHIAADGSWDAAITVVRARRAPASAQRGGRVYSRDPRTGYCLDAPGELVYEVEVHEDDDGGSGHGPRPLVAFELVATAQAAADVLTLWARRGSLFQCDLPTAKPEAATRQERRRYDHRQAAAAAPQVDATAVPPEAVDLAAAVDPARLCWFFPRERGGRYLRSAVVALAPCRDGRPHLSGPWLIARADGDRLLLEVRDLIPANQPHRWDATPWLWTGDADAPPALAPLPEAAFTALREGRIQAALDECGVLADPSISRLLAGQPTRLFRAELTEKWVANLYAGLADAAPWRLAAAYRAWRESRDALGLRTTEPVTLFGLGGMGQARKPKVALDLTPAGPTLCFRYTGGIAVLSRSLWTIPPDLEAQLRGWPPPRVPQR
jgi:hypothetical protein